MRRRLQRVAPALCGALITLVVAGPPFAAAAPGDIDTGFATGGNFTAPFMTTFPGAEDSHTVAVDSQGRVYLSATKEPQLNGGPIRQVNVVRLSPQGVPDGTFGSGGTATLPTTGDLRNAGIVIDDQDRPIILTNNGENVAGWRIGLTRLTTGGAPDPSFDGDGVVESALPNTSWNPWPAGIALDSGGGILVVGTLIACGGGSCPKNSGFIARFGSGGALDATYGTGGWTAVANSGTEMSAIHALPAGGAVVAGYDDYEEWVVTRLTAGGAPDPGFDGDGEARSNLGKQPLDIISDYGVTVDGQGRPVVLGQFTSGGNGSMVAARWTSAGAPDPSFGTGTPTAGVVLLPAGGRLRDAAAQCADGKLLVAGIGAPPGGQRNELLLARLDAGGALDTGFAAAGGTPGMAWFVSGDYNGGSDLALASAGAYVSGFRRQNDNAVYTDYPQVARFAAGCTAPVDFQLTVSVAGTGSVTSSPAGIDCGVDCAESYTDGSVVSLTAVPGPGQLFVGWGGACSGTATTCPVTMSAARNVVATFQATPPATFQATSPAMPAAAAAAAPGASPAAAALPAFSTLVTLPSTRRCVSRRKFSIRLRIPSASTVVEAVVQVNGKRVAVRRGARLRSTVDLRSLPKGRFRVEVILKLADGRRVLDSRRYRTCTPKRKR